jgi:hypothetical protein
MRCILAEDNRNVLIANDKSKMVVNCKKMWALARLPKRCRSLSPPSASGYVHAGWVMLDYDFKYFLLHHAIIFLFH